MKFKSLYISFFLIIIFSNYTFSLNEMNEKNILKYKKVGLIWGMLKYNHPKVSFGKYSWDKEFIDLLESLEGVELESEVDSLLFGFTNKFDLRNITLPEDLENIESSDYEWINSFFIDANLKSALVRISHNQRIGDYYAKIDNHNFLSFPNENELEKFDVSDYTHRLLLFFKFWNVIQYWDVNKEFTKNDWLSILDTYIRDFLKANNLYDFEILKSRLISELNDSHSYYLSKVVSDSLFKFKANFGVIYKNDSLVVNYIYNKEKCNLDNINIGDVITKINGKSIKHSIINKLSTLFSASNFNFLARYSYYLLCNETDNITITLVRDDKEVSQKITLSEKIIPQTPYTIEGKHASIEKLNKEDYYIDLSKLTNKECDSFFRSHYKLGVRNLILDLRNNSNLDLKIDNLCNYLVEEKKEFIKIIGPVKQRPLKSEVVESNGIISLILSPFKVGKKSKVRLVNGKIILMVNRRTQSRGEYFGMAIQQAKNCVTIGTQTAGSVMNITNFKLPDGTSFDFTSFKAFYPNSDFCVQEKGLNIDFEINVQVRDYHPDQYIEFAFEVLDK